ncbi:hypothetical protein HPB50_002593 [Hyalomma asiaticum]|uniref:Uncharacterized protein n=1 Tax=Hyalomma asiaticum TaxID=266040 RepID=A0ACB7SAR4_HYAAI|nr:hypothetical protein HPB50_002593 [Hyalomma asiaticum]
MVPVGTRYQQRDVHRFRARNTTNACQCEGHSTAKGLEKGHSVRIGSKYQARVPLTVPSGLPPADSTPDKAVQVWSPSSAISDSALDRYTSFAAEKYGYNEEQALGLLQWHGHDLAKAFAELGNFVPVADEWTAEDDARFANALIVHSKNFRVIQSMFPKKTIPNLVNHYYLRKRTRTHTSLLQYRVQRPTSAPRGRLLSENGKAQCGRTAVRKRSFRCCGLLEYVGASEKIDGVQREPEKINTTVKKDRYRQRYFSLKREDLEQLTSGWQCDFDTTMQAMDREIASMRKQVQKNKQDLSRLKHLYFRSAGVALPSRYSGRV